MTVRMSSLQYMYNYKLSLNRAYKKQADLMEHADGSRIHRGSDDPEGYAKLLRFNVTKFENNEYQQDVENAISFMKTEDATLSNMVSIAKTFAEKTIQAANTYNTSADYEAIAKEMYSCIEEVISLCNRQQGDRYVFSGQRDTTEPFVLSSEERERGVTKTLDTAQTKFFKNHISEGDSFVYQMAHLKDADGNSYYFDTESGDVFKRKFVDEDYKQLMTLNFENIAKAKEYLNSATTEERATTRYSEAKKLVEEGTYGTVTLKSDTNPTGFSMSDYFDTKGVIKDAKKTLTVNDTPLSFVTISQQIVTYNGDDKHISMVKENGATDMISDVVNVTGQDVFGFDLFDDPDKSGNVQSGAAFINSMLTVYEKIKAEDVAWLNSDGVSISNATHNQMLIAQTTIGSRIQLYENVSSMLNTQGDVVTEDITNVSGTDVAELATRLMEMTSLYNMSLSIGGRILPVSLADYL